MLGRRHAAELKTGVLAACNEPGASVAALSLSHVLNANLVHKWSRGVTPTHRALASSSTGHVAVEFIALGLPTSEAVPAAQADIRIELRRGATSVALGWPLAAAQSVRDMAARLAAQRAAMNRIDELWLAVEPLDMRADAERLLTRVVQVFGSARRVPLSLLPHQPWAAPYCGCR